MKQKSEEVQAIRIGNKQRLMGQNISKFCLLKIKRIPPASPFYAILTNHEQIFLFDQEFGLNHELQTTTESLLDLAYLKIHLRHDYKLPSSLHLKMRYSYNYQCIFILLSDGSIAVLNYDLYMLDNIKLIDSQKKNNPKYCLDYDYHQNSSNSLPKVKNCYFIFLFSDIVQIHELEIMTNHKLSKYKSSFKFALTPINRHVVDSQISHPISLKFINGLQQANCLQSALYIKKVIVCNCSKHIYFYFFRNDITETPKKLQISKTHDYGVYIIDHYIIFNLSKILISLSNGNIQIYSYKQQNFGKILNFMNVCNTSLLKMYLVNQTNKMLCYSDDCFLNIINLEVLAVEQRFKVGNYDQIQFITNERIIGVGFSLDNAFQDINPRFKLSKCLIFNHFNAKYRNILTYSSQILNYNITNQSQLIFFSDNSIVYNCLGEGNIQKTFYTYLPPNTVTVKCLSIYTFEKSSDYEEYWILTDKSYIYKYRFSRLNAPKVHQMLELNKFYDRQDSELKYVVNYFTFLTKIVCMEYDSESTGNDLVSKNKQRQPSRYICFGMTTGEIIIVSIENPTKIICRLKFLSKPITFIYEINIFLQKNTSKGILVYGSESANKLILIQMQQNQTPLQKYRISIDDLKLKLLNNNLLSIINENSFNLSFFVNSNAKCKMYMQQHFTPIVISNAVITNLTFFKEKQAEYIVVGYSLGQILIYQVKITQNQSINISLALCHSIVNSNMNPVEYICYRPPMISFNLHKQLVVYKLSAVEQQRQGLITQRNVRIDNFHSYVQEIKDRNKSVRKQRRYESIDSNKKVKYKDRLKTLQRKQMKQYMLPKVKEKGSPKKRSSSFNSIYKPTNKQKPDHLFHFPDIYLYRNLINKKIIL